MKQKLNTLLNNTNPQIKGFPAFQGLIKYGNENGEEITISTLPPAIMLENSNKKEVSYYTPVMPRGAIFHTPEEVHEADLEVNKIAVYQTQEITENDKVIIVSRHEETVKILKELYPYSKVMDAVTAEDIKDKNVVGGLPPALIPHCARYKAATIKDYDATVENDIKEDLESRLQLTKTIVVEVQECPLAIDEGEYLAYANKIVQNNRYEIFEGIEHGPGKLNDALRFVLNYVNTLAKKDA